MKTLLLATLVLLSFIVNVKATIHTVTHTGDDLSSPEEGMLRYYINNAKNGDTIVFDVEHITLAGRLTISYKSLTILGGEGVVIDGDSKDNVFSISYDSSKKVTLKNLTIQNGKKEGSLAMGGGMYVFGSGPKENVWVENCTFLNNKAESNGDGQGGALRTMGGTYVNCKFINNSVTGSAYSNSGGAVTSIGGVFINCLFVGNSANHGGGIYATNNTQIINCTITQNSTPDAENGAGIVIETGSSCVNSIVYNNFSNGTISNLKFYDGTFSYNALNPGDERVGTNNNIGLSQSPFQDAANSLFMLTENTPAIDAGLSTVDGITEFDLAGNKRISGSSIDLGAYELFVPTVISGVVKLEDGTLLANYMLHDKITTDENGNYRIEVGKDGISENEELVLNAAPEGFEFYPKIILANSTKTTHITAYNGIVVEGNYAPDSEVEWDSEIVNVFGTVMLNNVSLTIAPNTTVKFRGHYGIRVSGKGRIIALGTVNEPIIFTSAEKEKYILTSSSTAGSWNRIVFNNMSTEADSSKFRFCTFEYSKEVQNSQFGGALSVTRFDKLGLTNCTFYSNSVHNFTSPPGGGAIFINHSSINIVNCVINNNYCTYVNSGGAIFIEASNLKTVNIINCNITNNRAAGNGGAIYARGGISNTPYVTIYNSIISGNTANDRKEQLYGKLINAYNSFIEEAFVGELNAQENLIIQGVVFSNPGGTDFQLAANSVAINAGNLEYVADLLPKTDILGNPRINQNRIDIGAIEYQTDIISKVTGKVIDEHGEAVTNFELYPGIITNSEGEYTIVANQVNISNNDKLALNAPESKFIYPRKIVVGENMNKQIDITVYDHLVVDDETPFGETENWSNHINVLTNITLNNTKLTIAPGTTIKFYNQSHLKITDKGSIFAKGTSENQITFTAANIEKINLYNSSKKGTWSGIIFDSMHAEASTSIFDHCKVEGVKNLWSGGAFTINNFNRVDISNSTIRNSSGLDGGALYVSNSTLTIRNTIFKNNGTISRSNYGTEGGTIYARMSNVNLIGCIISNNTTFGSSGGIITIGGNLTIINSNIINNEFGFPSVDLKTVAASNTLVKIYNSIIWGNRRSSTYTQITNASNAFIYNSCIMNGSSLAAAAYVDCTEEDPMFVDAEIGDFRLKAESPLIDAGTQEIPNNLFPEVDIAQNRRAMGKNVDIGAYEHIEPTLYIFAPKAHPVNEVLNAEGLLHLANATSWSWDFNNDENEDADTQNATYTFAEKGIYTIRLTVIDDLSKTYTVLHSANIMSTPIADFKADTTASNRIVNFTDKSDNEPTQWLWSFGDGNTSTNQNPTHHYTQDGTYTVTLTASNIAGTHTETKTSYITIKRIPIPVFSVDITEGVAPLTVNFTNESTFFPTSYLWTFGNLSTSTEEHPAFTFTTPGTYSVTLRVNGTYGSISVVKANLIKVLAAPTSANDEAFRKLKLYPNPVKSTLVLESDKTYHVNINDITGKTILQTKISAFTETIDVSALPNGIYLIHFYNDSESFTERIIKAE
ncbi:PKD domain-containing protein [Alkaliflexus imshenetskii]|uniref:PKD domain-containing protein n=1 Tax=Alkaliflexus imshenetskii TaxID=286730 RepID=UPI0004B8B5F7|nr:PKD domain-containing protein [Alkaliflexus imshenetskii]